MPIEIRELVIKATVTPDGRPGTAAPVASTNNSITASEEMINAAVDKVLDILKDKTER